MKKFIKPSKLQLKTETVKTIKSTDLRNVAGGNDYTSTVHHTFDC